MAEICIDNFSNRKPCQFKLPIKTIFSFFQAMMYLIIKETGLNWISAECVARWNPHSPVSNVWLHDPSFFFSYIFFSDNYSMSDYNSCDLSHFNVEFCFSFTWLFTGFTEFVSRTQRLCAVEPMKVDYLPV